MKDINEEPLLSRLYTGAAHPPVLVDELDHVFVDGDLVVQGESSSERVRSSNYTFLECNR
jgi:hypothetical protein